MRFYCTNQPIRRHSEKMFNAKSCSDLPFNYMDGGASMKTHGNTVLKKTCLLIQLIMTTIYSICQCLLLWLTVTSGCCRICNI